MTGQESGIKTNLLIILNVDSFWADGKFTLTP